VNQDIKKVRKILITLFFFFLTGPCEIGGGYLVWQWIREEGRLYRIDWGYNFISIWYNIYASAISLRTYAVYGGIFII
jgi:small multidrug resistance family-3 protein